MHRVTSPRTPACYFVLVSPFLEEPPLPDPSDSQRSQLASIDLCFDSRVSTPVAARPQVRFLVLSLALK